jgi:hypothetical protein
MIPPAAVRIDSGASASAAPQPPSPAGEAAARRQVPGRGIASPTPATASRSFATALWRAHSLAACRPPVRPLFIPNDPQGAAPASDIRSESCPASSRNSVRLHAGTDGRLQIGKGGRLRRNPHLGRVSVGNSRSAPRAHWFLRSFSLRLATANATLGDRKIQRHIRGASSRLSDHVIHRTHSRSRRRRCQRTQTW